MLWKLATTDHCPNDNLTPKTTVTPDYKCIPDLGEAPMEAAILVHVHPLSPSFRPGGGQALHLPTVNLPTLYSLLLMIALEIYHQLN